MSQDMRVLAVKGQQLLQTLAVHLEQPAWCNESEACKQPASLN